MLLQANDFRHLHDVYGVELQMGGSDQWGNITAGIDLIRRTSGRPAHGLTWPLLLRSDGQKFGKSTGSAVWLDAERTSPYQFRQYWMQTDDADIAERLLRFSLRPVDELERSSPSTRRAGAPARPAGARPRAHRARPRDAPQPTPPTPPPTCSSAATRRPPRRRRWRSCAMRCRRRRCADDRARRSGRTARRHRSWPAPAATPGACSTSARTRANGVQLVPATSSPACPCCTTGTCCCARASTRITSLRFLATEVDVGGAGR